MAVKDSIATISQFLGLRTDTPASKCPANYSPDCSDLAFSVGGYATRNPFLKQVTLPAEVVYRKEFLSKDGTTQILALDVNGALYVVHAGGSYTQIDSVTPGSKVNSVTAYGREYMAFFNDSGGCDAPRQWDGKHLYRVSQGGPGNAPSFSATAIAGDSYEILTITQPAPGFPGQLGYFDGIEQSAGPGSSAAGNVVTVYTANARAGHFPFGDPALTAAFNSGIPVNLVLSNLPGAFAQFNGTQLVTSIGLGVPNFAGASAQRWYFTFEVDSSAHATLGGIDAGITGQYQMTAATMTMQSPVPGLSVGSQVPITGASQSGYDSLWTITDTVNSGSLNITQSSLTGGVATYNYSVTGGVAPIAGQAITITDTLNANGALNGENMAIATATGGDNGSFTISSFDPSVTFPPTAENGTGVTAGTVFTFDPLAIYGTSNGGQITFAGNDIAMASGTRLAVAFFITDTGLTTQAGPITKFTLPANTSAIAYSNLAIGPANVVARGMAFTGANGGNFFYLPIVPKVNGEVLGTATVINDNTTTSGTVKFTDEALFAGIAIDIPGNNLFQQVTLNLPRGVNWYGDRMLWIGEANTVIGFLNMGMDGGTLPGSAYPLGWKASGPLSIVQAGFMPVLQGGGDLVQSAYQTAQGIAILQPNLNYSVRVWMGGGGFRASISSASTGFYSTIYLNGTGYLSGPLSVQMPSVIPEDMILTIETADASIRDIQMIYADNPNRNPVARSSYVQNPEAYDALTGNVGPNDDSTELRATFVLQESLHFITQKGLYSTRQIGNTEPSSWDVNPISDKCGAFNSNSVVTGKGWASWGGPEGLFWYGGRIPSKTTQIISPTWRSVSNISNIYNDSDYERVYIGTVDKDGNKKMLVYDYHEIELGGAGKWCPWNRPLDWVGSSSNGTVFVIGAKFFSLSTNPGTEDDDLGPIGGYHVFPPIGTSMFLKLYSYFGLRITGTGALTPFVYGQTLQAVTATLKAQELSTLIDTVAEWPANVKGRLMYLKLGQPGVQYSLEDMTAIYQPDDPNTPVSGVR